MKPGRTMLIGWLCLMLLVSVEVSGQNRPLIIAHRGGALESTENTIEAFQRATRLGVDGIETDLRLTRDRVVVVYHDEKFGRVEGLPGMQQTRPVSDMTLSELTAQTLRPVGEDLGGRKVPTFRMLLSEVNDGILNIEIKRGDRFNVLVDSTIVILRGFNELDRVVLEPPDLKTARKLRKALGPRLKLQINPAFDSRVPLLKAVRNVIKFRPHSISISHGRVTREIVEMAHRAGVQVWVWTVDDTATARRMTELGVDAIKTDRPTELLEMMRNHPAPRRNR